MRLSITFLAVGTSILLGQLSMVRAEHPVDANIVTGLDLSPSIMRHEEWIELDGMQRAVGHPAFLAAIRAGAYRRIGFAAFTWSSHGELRVIVPWVVLGSAADLQPVVDALAQVPRRGDTSFGGDHEPPSVPLVPERLTDISEALSFAHGLFAAAPHRSGRSILNICGNGIDNVGEGPEATRDRAVAAGITVNGLVVGASPNVAAYYRDRVAGGPGAFVIEAVEPRGIREAMLRKFVRDLLATRPPVEHLHHQVGALKAGATRDMVGHAAVSLATSPVP